MTDNALVTGIRMNTPKPLPARWVGLLTSAPEAVLYGVTIASELARYADDDGTLTIDLKALQRFLAAHLRHPAKRTAGEIIFGLVTAGWLTVVDLDRMIFRLSVPSDLGPVPVPTEYVKTEAIKRPTGRQKYMRPTKVKKA